MTLISPLLPATASVVVIFAMIANHPLDLLLCPRRCQQINPPHFPVANRRGNYPLLLFILVLLYLLIYSNKNKLWQMYRDAITTLRCITDLSTSFYFSTSAYYVVDAVISQST